MVKYEPKEQTVVKPGDVVELNSSGQLVCEWKSSDDNVVHIIHQMTEIWKHCEFPNGYIHDCRPYINRLESKPQRYVLVVRTTHNRAKTIDWGKEEWTVNIVGEPQLKIKGILIGDGTTWGHHIGWDIMFYIDVLDVVKPEGKRPESVYIDEDAVMPFSVREGFAEDSRQKFKRALNSAYGYLTSTRAFNIPGFDLSVLNDTANPLWPKDNPALEYIDTDIALTRAAYKRGGNTMNNHEIETAIRDGGYTDYQRNIIKGFLLRNGLLSNTKLEEVRNIRRDLRPSPKKVIYNGPATIVIFEDGSKTVVKLQDGETMDREKAVYAAICKRMFGSNKNRSNWLDILKPLMKSADEAWRVKSEKKL